MASIVSYARKGDVGVITVDHPPVNALSQAVRQGLLDALRQGNADDQAKALVLLGAGRTFIAGADIREFGKPLQEPDLNSVIATYESSAKPVVAAIHGTALGGGLEVALGCHYRVAVPGAKIGLPEVKLGILPGAGGTQRLTRVVGVEAAIDMITTGKFVPVEKAHPMGLIDALVDDLAEGAITFARSMADKGGPHPKVRDRDDKIANFADRPEFFDQARREVAKRARGQMSPVVCVDAIEAAATLPFEQGLKRERELFLKLVASDQSKALRHVFFAEREVQKIPDVAPDTKPRPIERAGVIGAGTMGSGIAMAFADAGLPVTVVESEQAALDRGMKGIEAVYGAQVTKGRLSQDEAKRKRDLISPSLSMDALADADIVVEAVFEEMEVKREVFAKLDGICKPGAILATNTSTLDIDQIAAATKRPQDVVGTHFFSPAHVMKLLENVRGRDSADDVLVTVMKLGKMLRKVPVLVGNCDGFVGNRMVDKYFQQANQMLEEGALPQQIDRVMTEFGMPMGPFTMADMAGLDIGWRIRKRRAATRPKNIRHAVIADRICEQGRFGQKTGTGYYAYAEGDRTPRPDPAVEAIIVETSKALGITRREISDEEILKRCLYPLINEGARILEEGIAARPGDIDIIYVYGYGFPAWRGGPMFYADLVGLAAVLDDIRRFHREHDDFWRPAPLLERLADEGRGFADLGRR